MPSSDSTPLPVTHGQPGQTGSVKPNASADVSPGETKAVVVDAKELAGGSFAAVARATRDLFPDPAYRPVDGPGGVDRETGGGDAQGQLRREGRGG